MEALQEQIASLSDAELDVFPFGVTRLDHHGKICFFNQIEEQFTGRKAAEAVGLNFFRDVAPCAAVRDFQGRFNEFVENLSLTTTTFGFIYPFWLKHRQVKITMVRRPGDDDNIFLITEFMQSSAV